MYISPLSSNLFSTYRQFKPNSSPKKFKGNNSKISFGAGWNSQVEEKIKKCDIEKIVNKLKENYGIDADFKGNKIIAWCCYKVVKIFKHLNQDYHLKLDLPKAIYVEDFSKLKASTDMDYSYCNMYPAYVVKNSNKVFPERTLFFNSSLPKSPTRNLSRWEDIDSITEDLHLNGIASSNHFLNLFIHEFCHSAHDGHLFKHFKVKNSEGYVIEENRQKLLNKLTAQKSENYSAIYRQKFGGLISYLCEYASANPFETIACDMSQKIDKTLDEAKLYPNQNPFKYYFYPNKHLFSSFISLFKNESNNIQEKFLKKVWNGEELF